MIKVNPIISNFTSGELSKDLLGRADVERFFNGAEIIENFHVRPSGGIYRRLGTKRIAETDCPNSRLIPFVRSRAEAFTLELGCGEIKIVTPTGYLGTQIPCSVLAANGGTQEFVTYEVILGEGTGNVYLTYNAGGIGDRFVVRWNETDAIDTGVVTGPGQTSFNKTLATPTIAYVDIYSPSPGSAWEFQLSCPGSTPPPDPTPEGFYTGTEFTEDGEVFDLVTSADADATGHLTAAGYLLTTVTMIQDGALHDFAIFLSPDNDPPPIGVARGVSYLTVPGGVYTSGFAVELP
jgi:hypothetical protein